MRRIELLSGVTVLALGFLSAVPAICATEPPEVDTKGNVMGERATPGEGAALSLPLRTTENFTLGAITESSAEAAEADKLAKQLANPIASLISVPFQANEDWGFGPTGNGYKFTLNIQPVQASRDRREDGFGKVTITPEEDIGRHSLGQSHQGE